MNDETRKGKYKAFAGLVILALVFFIMSYLTQEHEATIRTLIGEEKTLGMLLYILVTATAVTVSPISTIPLIPLATSMWGWILSGILSVLGWLLGAQIAFMLARHYGKPLVQKVMSIEKLEKFERQIPEEHLFWTVVFLRMFVSVDLLSWALGLFSNMKNVPYITATLIGITPFAFIFAYTGTLSIPYQIAILVVACGVTLVWYIFRKRIYNKG